MRAVPIVVLAIVIPAVVANSIVAVAMNAATGMDMNPITRLTPTTVVQSTLMSALIRFRICIAKEQRKR